MEPKDIQQQKGVEMSHGDEQLAQKVPATLLSGVLSRIEQRDMYLAAPRSTQDLMQALKHPQWEIRAAALRLLGEAGEQAPVNLLVTGLQDEHRLVRAAAARALGQLGARAPLDQLIIAMHDREWEVREMVTLALGELGELTPRPLLLAAQCDSNGSVRDAATYALHKRDAMLSRSVSVLKTANAKMHSQAQETQRHRKCDLLRMWSLFRRQIPLINKSIWSGTAFVMFLMSSLVLFGTSQPGANVHKAEMILALVATVCSATATAFIYGEENDPGFEITLSTPTSHRILMLYRFLLVAAYNVLLSACASGIVALVHGGSPWEIVQLWLGPMLLVSSFTLTLSLLIGSWFAVLAGLILEASQTIQFNLDEHLPTLQLGISSIWQTNAIILIFAVLCLTFALLYAPRQPRLTS